MKKAIILAAMLALPTFAGQKLIYNTPAPAVTAPAVDSGHGLEIGYFISWAANDIYKDWSPCKEIRTNGVDVTALYDFNRNHAMTLRLAYGFGARSWADGAYEIDGESWTENARVRMHTFSLMPGYRYTHALCDKTSLYCGVNVGVSNQSLKYRGADSSDVTYPGYSEHEDGTMKQHGSQWGLAYSAEAGVRYAITEAVDFFVAYQFTGNTCKPKLDGGEGYHVRGKAQNYHGVRAGFGIKF